MTWDPIWENIYSSREWGRYPGEELIRFAARNFYFVPKSDRKNISFLEIGCGNGSNLWFLSREGFSVHGIDGSTSAIIQARQRLDQEIPNWSGDLNVGDIQSLNYPNECMDAIIDNEAVYCSVKRDSISIYTEATRVLKRKGLIFVRTFSTGSCSTFDREEVGENTYIFSNGPFADKGITRLTSKEEIQSLLGPSIKIVHLEQISTTCGDMSDVVAEWIVYGQKE